MDAVLDTLAHVRRLREAGVDDARAEAHAEAKVSVLQRVIGLDALASPALAARPFGAI